MRLERGSSNCNRCRAATCGGFRWFRHAHCALFGTEAVATVQPSALSERLRHGDGSVEVVRIDQWGARHTRANHNAHCCRRAVRPHPRVPLLLSRIRFYGAYPGRNLRSGSKPRRTGRGSSPSRGIANAAAPKVATGHNGAVLMLSTDDPCE